MTLTFKSISKNNKTAIYSGLRTNIRFSTTNFVDATPPATLEISGAFAGARQPKPKLTKEERAALPKPTAAERVKKAEERLERMKAKMAKELVTA